ncbi:MAG TPA: DUF4214 domain-containing protein, partial [Acidimicrobiales bacterium]
GFSYRYTPTTGSLAIASVDITSSAPTQQVILTGGLNQSVTDAFVHGAYGALTGQGPTTSQASSARAALDGGTMTRGAFVTGLANSAARVAAVVNRLYQDTLGRAGDSGGVTYWVGQIRSGHRSVADVAAQFFASPEYYTHLGGGTDASWIADLYVKLLDRTADSGGLTYWKNQTSAHGRVNVAGRFYQSIESRQDRVTALYESLLRRDPDAAGRDYWAAQILQHGDIALAADLAASIEFVNDAAILGSNG